MPSGSVVSRTWQTCGMQEHQLVTTEGSSFPDKSSVTPCINNKDFIVPSTHPPTGSVVCGGVGTVGACHQEFELEDIKIKRLLFEVEGSCSDIGTYFLRPTCLTVAVLSSWDHMASVWEGREPGDPPEVTPDSELWPEKCWCIEPPSPVATTSSGGLWMVRLKCERPVWITTSSNGLGRRLVRLGAGPLSGSAVLRVDPSREPSGTGPRRADVLTPPRPAPSKKVTSGSPP